MNARDQPNAGESHELMTEEQVSELVQLSQRTLRRPELRGEIPASIRIGGSKLNHGRQRARAAARTTSLPPSHRASNECARSARVGSAQEFRASLDFRSRSGNGFRFVQTSQPQIAAGSLGDRTSFDVRDGFPLSSNLNLHARRKGVHTDPVLLGSGIFAPREDFRAW